jgi:hypothetical protein
MTPQYIKIYEDGNKFYYKDKEMTILHREDGPAVEWSNGNKFWYLNDVLHREDGPAVEWINGDKVWFLNDENLTEEEFKKKTAKKTAKKTVLTMDEIAERLGIDVSKIKIAK